MSNLKFLILILIILFLIKTNIHSSQKSFILDTNSINLVDSTKFILSDIVKYKAIGITGSIILSSGCLELISGFSLAFSGLIYGYSLAAASAHSPVKYNWSYDQDLIYNSLVYSGLGLTLSSLILIVSGLVLTIYGFKKYKDVTNEITLYFNTNFDLIHIVFVKKI